MTNTHKVTRHSAGLYFFTGHIGDRLVQYSILKTDSEWKINKTYGNGPEFYTGFATKRAAVTALATA
jgi:hypothetical protein